MNGMLATNYHKYTTKEMNESTLACLYCNLPMKKELILYGYAIQHICLGCGHREIDQVTQCSLYHRSIPSLKRSD